MENKPNYSLGDVIDKLAILTMKIYFGDESSISEHRYLEKGLEGWGLNGKVITNTIRLTLMNRLVWEEEHEARKCMKSEKDMTERELIKQGKINIRVRDFNRKRVEYKNVLNADHKGFKESKIQHRSS
jgi:hypothetical protein